MQTPISSVITPRGCAPGSGQAVVVARLIKLPQMPWVMLVEEALKHSPRHCVLRGVVSPGRVSVIEGLQGDPSARRVRFAAAPQKPVRTLHEPVEHCELLVQKGKHPAVVSGVCAKSARVEQAQPARHVPDPAVQLAVQKPSPVIESSTRQVAVPPPHSLRSLDCDGLLAHPPVQLSCPATGAHSSSEPHTGSVGDEHDRPAAALPPPPVHTPFEQLCPAAQAFKHDPQFCALFSGFTQVPPHEMLGAVHPPPPVQLPLEQLCPPGHCRLQNPQWSVLLSTSTHSPPHIILGAMQLGPPTQVPFEHDCPDEHASPQMPQFCESVRVFTQRPLHEVRGEAQVVPPSQLPLTQLCPAAQALPQAPQFCALLLVSTQPVAHIILGA